MGTQGVKFAVKKSDIIEALKKNKGKITYACKTLNCRYETLLKRINQDPELVKLLSDLRNEFNNILLDSAEDTLMFAIAKRDTDLTSALKSTFFIINNKGKERGYVANYKNEEAENLTSPNDQVNSLMIENAKLLERLKLLEEKNNAA